MDFVKAEPDLGYSYVENKMTERNDEEDPLFILFPTIKTENEVSFICVCTLTVACSLSVSMPDETSPQESGCGRNFVIIRLC
jgi:hypothetical protein